MWETLVTSKAGDHNGLQEESDGGPAKKHEI